MMRIYVGGVGESVNRDDVVNIFSPMGSVEAVDFVRTKGRSFAYIDFSPSSPTSLSKLFSMYNGCVWKGGRLRLERAKEHYLARFRREWEEDAALSATCASVNPPQASAQDQTHLKLFFPRLRKVKSVPFSGTGKHKYSFPRVQVPPLPIYFCDCEEHSMSHTPQADHAHDLETPYVGINEEELNIMNSVMNRLFHGENHTSSGQDNKSDLVNDQDNNVGPSELDLEADEDNLIINVVSSGNNTLPLSRNWEQETVSRKRKSVFGGMQIAGEGSTTYDTQVQRNSAHPNKKRQSSSLEGGGRKELTHAEQPENREPSEVDPHKSLSILGGPVSGVKHSTSSVYWSQKSSWKALVVNGGSSRFSVSSVLSGFTSSKEEQPTSCDTDFVDMDTQENVGLKDSDAPSSTEAPTAKDAVNKQRSERPTPMRKTKKLVVADINKRNESTAADPVGGDTAKTLPNTERSVKSTVMDHSFQKLSGQAVAGDYGSSPIVSRLLGSPEDDHSRSENFSSAKDADKEKQNLGVKDNTDDELDKVDAGKGLPGASNRSKRGSSWLQKSPWTQLVNERSSSFSITQLFPGLTLEKQEPRVVNHGDGEKSNSNKRKREVRPSEYEYCDDDSGATTEIIQESVARDSADGSGQRVVEGRGIATKKTFGGNRGIGEACTFMRNAASLKEWANAKKALSGTRKRKGNEN